MGVAVDAIKSPKLAGRWWRFCATMIDGVVGVLAVLPLAIYFDIWETIRAGQQPEVMVRVLSFLWGIGSFILINYRLLDTRGQTVGKWCLDLAIVGTDGQRKSALHILTYRYLPLWIIGTIPALVNIVAFIDGLFIFRADRRCIHDIMAGTKVIDVDPRRL